jgi:hypothetical protein
MALRGRHLFEKGYLPRTRLSEIRISSNGISFFSYDLLTLFLLKQ